MVFDPAISTLIIGFGPAAMLAALSLSEQGLPVIVISGGGASEASRARTGLLSFFHQTTDEIFQNWVESSEYLVKQSLVRDVLTRLPQILDFLLRSGFVLPVNEDGSFVQTKAEDGVCLLGAGTSVGLSLMSVLKSQFRRRVHEGKIQILHDHEMVKAILDSRGHVCGVIVQELNSMVLRAIKARAVIVASGGFSRLLRDKEWGNEAGISLLGRLFQQGAVLTDPEFFYDTQTSLGGLWIDGRNMTSLPGLFAAGEVAGFYFGARALSGSGLWQALASGLQAAEGVQNYLADYSATWSIADSECENQLSLVRQEFAVVLDRAGSEREGDLASAIKNLARDALLGERHHSHLSQALASLQSLEEKLWRVSVVDKSMWCNREALSVFYSHSIIFILRAILEAAKLRYETRQTQVKKKFSRSDQNLFLRHTRVSFSTRGIDISYEDPDLSFFYPHISSTHLQGLAGGKV